MNRLLAILPFCAFPSAALAAPIQCDGRTDSSRAVTQAIASLPNGGTLKLPRGGKCVFRSPVVVKRSGITVVGAGATIARLGEGSAFRVDGDRNRFSDFTIDGSQSSKGSGIVVAGSGNAFDRIKSTGNAGHGIALGGLGPGCSRNTVSNSTFSGNGAVGIAQHTCAYNRIINNRALNNGAEGITADHQSDHSLIQGNILAGNVRKGGVGAIGIDYADGVTVIKNQIGKNAMARPAIRTQNNQGPSKNLLIESNRIAPNAAGCVDLKTGTGGPTSDSKVENNQCGRGMVAIGTGGRGNRISGNDGPTRNVDTPPTS